MKATLEFQLPLEIQEFNRANEALNMACALFDILLLRKNITREYDATTEDNLPDCYDAIKLMDSNIAKILDKYNLNIEHLIR